MPQASDQTYLLNEQYKNSANLTARIQLHERFSVNTYDWYRLRKGIHFQIAIEHIGICAAVSRCSKERNRAGRERCVTPCIKPETIDIKRYTSSPRKNL